MKECLICKSKVLHKIEIAKTKREYYACGECGFISLESSYAVSRNKQKERYLLHENSLADKGYVKMLSDFLDFAAEGKIKEIEDKTKHALDFGCGKEPVLTELLKRRGYSVEVFDAFFHPNPDYKKKKYDLITATEVFEHLENPLVEFKELAGLLNNEGKIAVMTLIRPESEEDFKKWWYITDETHISFFSMKSFEILAGKCGLKILKTDGKRIIVFGKLNDEAKQGEESASSSDDIGFAKENHWNMLVGKNYLIALANIGDKTMVVYMNESDKGIKTSVQIVDKDNNGYFARVEDGVLVETYTKEDKKLENPANKNYLKEYLPVLHTLPEKLKKAINPLFL